MTKYDRGESWEDQTMRGNRLLTDCQQQIVNIPTDMTQTASISVPAQATAPDTWADIRKAIGQRMGGIDAYGTWVSIEAALAAERACHLAEIANLSIQRDSALRAFRECEIARAQTRDTQTAERASHQQEVERLKAELFGLDSDFDSLAGHHAATEQTLDAAMSDRQQLLDALKAVTDGMDRGGRVVFLQERDFLPAIKSLQDVQTRK